MYDRIYLDCSGSMACPTIIEKGFPPRKGTDYEEQLRSKLLEIYPHDRLFQFGVKVTPLTDPPEHGGTFVVPLVDHIKTLPIGSTVLVITDEFLNNFTSPIFSHPDITIMDVQECYKAMFNTPPTVDTWARHIPTLLYSLPISSKEVTSAEKCRINSWKVGDYITLDSHKLSLKITAIGDTKVLCRKVIPTVSIENEMVYDLLDPAWRRFT